MVLFREKAENIGVRFRLFGAWIARRWVGARARVPSLALALFSALASGCFELPPLEPAAETEDLATQDDSAVSGGFSGPAAIHVGTPSRLLVDSGIYTEIPLIFSNAASYKSMADRHLSLTTVSGNAECSGQLTDLTATGAKVLLYSCQYDGQIKLRILAGAIKNSAGLINPQSDYSAVVTVDNTPPDATISAGTAVVELPAALDVQFTEQVKWKAGYGPLGLSSAEIEFIEGGCTGGSGNNGMPGKTETLGTAQGGGGSLGIALNWSGVTCQDGTAIRVSVNKAAFEDLLGHPGAGQISAVYYFDKDLPAVALGEPSRTLVNQSDTSTLSVALTKAVSGTISASTIHVVAVDSQGNEDPSGTQGCDLQILLHSALQSYDLLLSNCSSGTSLPQSGDPVPKIRIKIDGGAVLSSTQKSSAEAWSQPISIDTVAPVAASQPGTSGAVLPSQFQMVFEEPVSLVDPLQDGVSIQGTCTDIDGNSATPLHTAELGQDGKTLTIDVIWQDFPNGFPITCEAGTGITLTLDRSRYQDAAGNPGAGTASTSYLYSP